MANMPVDIFDLPVGKKHQSDKMQTIIASVKEMKLANQWNDAIAISILGSRMAGPARKYFQFLTAPGRGVDGHLYEQLPAPPTQSIYPCKVVVRPVDNNKGER